MLIDRPTTPLYSPPTELGSASDTAVRPSTTGAQERVRQIVDAAAAVMSRQGYANTSMKDIAQEAGIAQGLIHYYFGSKEDLLVAVVRDQNLRMIAEVEAAMVEAGDDPLAQMWASVKSIRDGCGSRPEFIRLYFDLLTQSFSNEALRAEVARLYADLTSATAVMCARCSERMPTPMPMPEKDFAAVLVAAFDGVMLRSVIDPEYNHDDLYKALGFLLLSSGATSWFMAGQAPPMESFIELVGPDAVPPTADQQT
jgi:AcrR family transcriptional regulator